MQLSLRAATDADFDFCESLSREHMAGYRQARGIAWDPGRYRGSWAEFENLLVEVDGERVGALRLSMAEGALEIRDLQVLPGLRGRGIGAWAVRQARAMALERGLPELRLRVFPDNPARRLYQRLGFIESATVDGIIHMSRPASAAATGSEEDPGD